jgi:hypothetical protein
VTEAPGPDTGAWPYLELIAAGCGIGDPTATWLASWPA